MDSIGLVERKVRLEAGCEPELVDGERFLQTLAETGGGARMLGLQMIGGKRSSDAARSVSDPS